MEEILDEVNGQSQRSNINSKLSFAISLITLICFLMILSQIPTRLKASAGFPAISTTLLIFTLVSCLAGVIFTAISIARKERLKYLKWVGALLNILFFLLIFGSMVYARILDYTN